MNKNKVPNFTSKASPRSKHRYFSETARKAIVTEIDEGLSKAEASRKYEVSQTTIYSWLKKYSKTYQATLKVRVEHESDSEKNKLLKTELSKAYEALGRSQAENLLLQKVLELASEHFEMDLKKNFEDQHLAITIKKEKKRQ